MSCIFDFCSCFHAKKSQEIDDTKAVEYKMNRELEIKKISEVFISFSHNTFIETKQQILSFSSVKTVIDTILNGVRGIELDIWDDTDNTTPMVAHGANWANLNLIASNPIKFEDYIKEIANYAWKHSDFPLFLCLELNAQQEKTKNAIADIMKKYLQDRFINSSTPLGQLTLGDIKNKVIIITGGGYNTELRKIINYTYNDNCRNIGYDSIKNYPDLTEFNKRCFTRIYPTNLLGENYDPNVAWAQGCTAIAMNYNHPDNHLTTYKDAFKESPIIEKTRIMYKT